MRARKITCRRAPNGFAHRFSFFCALIMFPLAGSLAFSFINTIIRKSINEFYCIQAVIISTGIQGFGFSLCLCVLAVFFLFSPLASLSACPQNISRQSESPSHRTCSLGNSTLINSLRIQISCNVILPELTIALLSHATSSLVLPTRPGVPHIFFWT